MNKKKNNKGFTLVELLTVMVILIIIITVAIPSITASISRADSKKLDAQKKSIISAIQIKLKKSDFIDHNEYNKFKTKGCSLTLEQAKNKQYVTDEMAENISNDASICYEEFDCDVSTECELKP